MVIYTKKGKSQYQRKQRRIAKYGKFKRGYRLAGRRYDYIGGMRGIKKFMVPRFKNPFQQNYENVQLCYFDNISLNPTSSTIGAGGSNRWAFSFSSCWDPDVTGTGNQPMYFDNYASIYERYKVSFAKIQVTVVNHNVNTAVWNGTTTVTQPNYSYKLLLVRDADDADLPANVEQLIEQNASNVKWRYVAPQLNGSLPKLSLKCAPHKQAQVAYDDDTLQALTSQNPTRNIKGNIIIASADGVTDPPSVNLAVKITYYVKFFDRKVNQPVN